MAMATATVVNPSHDEPHGKLGTWWFLSSEIPTFGAILVSYIVMRLGSAGWESAAAHLNFNIALINTFLLLTSSMTIVMAHAAVQENNYRRCSYFLGLTVLLGVGFLLMKGIEYATEMRHGFLPGSGIFWSFYYGMTGLHALHVLAGIVINCLLWLQAIRGSLTTHSYRVELAGLYWHFVDIVWIFLFPLLYLS